MLEDPKVSFVGYRVPHPLSTNIEMRVVSLEIVHSLGSDDRCRISSFKSDDGKL